MPAPDGCVGHLRVSVRVSAHDRDEHIGWAQQRLTDLFGQVLTGAAEVGAVRGDVAPDELANYCLHALSAASGLPSDGAVRRLVDVTLAGLRPRS